MCRYTASLTNELKCPTGHSSSATYLDAHQRTRRRRQLRLAARRRLAAVGGALLQLARCMCPSGLPQRGCGLQQAQEAASRGLGERPGQQHGSASFPNQADVVWMLTQ